MNGKNPLSVQPGHWVLCPGAPVQQHPHTEIHCPEEANAQDSDGCLWKPMINAGCDGGARQIGLTALGCCLQGTAALAVLQGELQGHPMRTEPLPLLSYLIFLN